MNNDDIVAKAKALAHRAHEGQLLFKKKAPIMLHIAEVADLVEQVGGSSEQIAAAWLHDAVEDTATSLEDIRQNFGEKVALLVDELTDPEHFSGRPESERKRMQVERIRTISDGAKLVKLADQASNTRLAGTEHRSWDIPTTLQYIDGARNIAAICKGISPKLDEIFERYFQDTRSKLLAVSN